MGKKIGVVLSGCGVFDGTEIHEAVLTLLALDRAGAEAVCMAPDMDQHHVINHLTGEPTEEKRNVLLESARIARGEIKDLKTVSSGDIDALIMPGGFGAAKNLSDFAFSGPDAEVNPDLKKLILELNKEKKPVGAICISPAALAKALYGKGIKVTIGNDVSTAAAIEATGSRHENCPVDSVVTDEENRVVSTPAYMLGPGIKDVAEGINKLVEKVLSMTL
ncbi:MAG: isoprenoid biosynthesis glyoxalase ElbB [Desulfobacteraceae bacterium]